MGMMFLYKYIDKLLFFNQNLYKNTKNGRQTLWIALS